MRHWQITGYNAYHQWCYVGADDPADDPENDVQADKAWWDTAEERLKFRNAANTDWLYIGVSS